MADQDVRNQIMEVLSDPLNLPDVFWGYMVQRWIADAPVLPLSQVFGYQQFAAKMSYLGAFTLAQWPPPSPTDGDVALIYGVDDGSTFAWLSQYQPTLLGSTYPWAPPPAVTNGYSIKTTGSTAGAHLLTAAGWVYTGNVTQPAAVAFTKNIPLAGIWKLSAFAGFYDQTATADTVGVGVSSTSTVQPTAGNLNTGALNASGRGSVEMTGGQLTIAAANTNVFGWLNQTTTAHVILVPSFSIGIAPVQHA